MRSFLPVLFFFLAATVSAQDTKQVDSLSFCFNEYKVPPDCTAQSAYQVSCDNYSMMWLYMTEQMLVSVPEQFVIQMTSQVKVLKKEPLTCYLLGTQAKGYLVSFKKGDGIAYQVIAWGIANQQPVLVQLILSNEPKKNEDIPVFPGQIIRLTK